MGLTNNALYKLGVTISIMAILVTGCAKPKNPDDPFESYNRHMFNINRGFDTLVFKPIGYLYFKGVPGQVRLGISNVFANLSLPTVFTNDLLQGEFKKAGESFWRLVINSTVGVLGIFDVASKIGFEPHQNDFGQTLYKWGVKDAPYLILPVLGSSNLRDMLGTAVDYTAFTPSIYLSWDEVYFSQLGYRVFDKRVFMLAANDFIKEAFDPYIFVRDAYLQKRNKVLGIVAKPTQTDAQGTATDAASTEEDPFVDWPEEPSPTDETQSTEQTPTDGTSTTDQAPSQPGGTDITPTQELSNTDQAPAKPTGTDITPTNESSSTEQPPAKSTGIDITPTNESSHTDHQEPTKPVGIDTNKNNTQ